MAGPVIRGEKNVLWASRSKDITSTSRHPSQPGLPEQASEPTSSLDDTRAAFTAQLAAPREDNADPLGAKTPGPRRDPYTAPAELGRSHREALTRVISVKSTTLPNQQADFELDPEGPLRAVRAGAGLVDSQVASPLGLVAEEHGQVDDETGAEAEHQQGREDTWGDCFKIEWLCTERLPFYWTRNLRNSWNHDREVKISRDGTELEPTVGEMLLNAWEEMRAGGGEIPPKTSEQSNQSRKVGQSRRQMGGGRPAAENTRSGAARE